MALLPLVLGVERPVHTRAGILPVEVLDQLTRRGDVALIESRPDSGCRQVMLLSRFEQSPERVFEAFVDIQSYPEAMSVLSSITVLDQDDGLLAYRWLASIPPVIRLTGVRLQRAKRPVLIEVRGHSGHLRGTRERIEFYPVPGGTLVALYRGLDVDTGGWLVRAFMGIDPSMEQGLTLASLMIHMNGIRRRLDPDPEQRTDSFAESGPRPSLHSLGLGTTSLPHEAVAPMLELGTLALIESTDAGRVRQVALLTSVEAPSTRVREVVAAPQRYPEFISSLKDQSAELRADGSLDLTWHIKVPMVSMKGTSRMDFLDDGSIEVRTTSGDIADGLWRWEFHSVGEERSIPVLYVYHDLRKSSFVTGLLLEAEPLLEHGMVGASGAIALSSMKTRAETR